MKILITGANRGLGENLTREFLKNKNNLYLTARKESSLAEFENADVKKYELDLSSLVSINNFFKNEDSFEELDLIIHCASSFEGTLKDSSYSELDIWSNSYSAALKLSKFASRKLSKTGKLIFIGSVVGSEGHISESCVPYSVYKGTLKLLAEGFQKEFGKSAIYINLGGFRDEATDEYLQTNQVVSSILNIAETDYRDIQFNLMSKKDEQSYL
jgi:short-subunit dehydrogenase